jgi:hypothetical protein
MLHRWGVKAEVGGAGSLEPPERWVGEVVVPFLLGKSSVSACWGGRWGIGSGALRWRSHRCHFCWGSYQCWLVGEVAAACWMREEGG